MKRRINKILIPILAVSIMFGMLFASGITASATEVSVSESDSSIYAEEATPEDIPTEETEGETAVEEENPSKEPEESTSENLPEENPKAPPEEIIEEDKPEENPSNSQEESTSENFPTENPIILEEKNSISNIFDELYLRLEKNSDKIFSILAFIGTLVVGIGYKSGLLPLLRDALSRLKSSIDLVKEDGDKNNLITTEKFSDINKSIDKINESLDKNTDELTRIKWQFEGYEELCAERESMRLILLNQVDMLYAIFMSSALPQYQKDEIGEKIKNMREELLIYEKSEN